MKHTIRATVSSDTFTFTVHDNVRIFQIFSNMGGITLGKNSVYLKRSLKDALQRNRYLIAHEAVHVRQAHILGWKYLPTYLWQAIRAGFVKRRIPMEQDAYTQERHVTWEVL